MLMLIFHCLILILLAPYPMNQVRQAVVVAAAVAAVVIKAAAVIKANRFRRINYFYSDDEQLRNIESISLEEQVVEIIKSEAKSVDENISYEDCVSGTYG